MSDRPIVEQWLGAIRLFHMAHHMAASRNSRLHRALGIPVVIATTVVGTTVFASIGDSQSTAVAIVVGSLSVTAAVLASLQTFLNHSENAERHKTAAVKYGMLRRELEQFLAQPSHTDAETVDFMDDFRPRWDRVDLESPPIPQDIHDAAQKRIAAAPRG